MQGLGNDYVYVDCTKEELATPSDIAKAVSDRHFGIGSDGLILIKPSKVADFYMEMYNADGSRSAMCGNGIRCVGKYVYDFGLTDKLDVSIETAAGIKYLNLRLLGGQVGEVRVNMGAPIFEPALIPTTLEATRKIEADGSDLAAPLHEGYENPVPDKVPVVLDAPLTVEGKEYRVSCVSMGNPHVITYVDDEKTIDIEKIDRSLRAILYSRSALTRSLYVLRIGRTSICACGREERVRRLRAGQVHVRPPLQPC